MADIGFRSMVDTGVVAGINNYQRGLLDQKLPTKSSSIWSKRPAERPHDLMI